MSHYKLGMFTIFVFDFVFYQMTKQIGVKFETSDDLIFSTH